MSLEEQKVKIEERLRFLLKHKKTSLPWEELSAEEKERLAWKVEMSVKAKERNKILAEEKVRSLQCSQHHPAARSADSLTSYPGKYCPGGCF